MASSTAEATASLAARSLQPSPMSACVTCAATPGGTPAPVAPIARGASILPASCTTMSLAVLGPMPETRRNGASSSAVTASAICATLSAASTPRADFGPTPVTLSSWVNTIELVAALEAEQREGVFADDEVRVQVHLVADVRRGGDVRRDGDGEPHAADLDDEGVGIDVGGPTAQRRDHASSLEPGSQFCSTDTRCATVCGQRWAGTQRRARRSASAHRRCAGVSVPPRGPALRRRARRGTGRGRAHRRRRRAAAASSRRRMRAIMVCT